MRLAITIGRPHDAKEFTVLSGPDVSIGQQIVDYKEMQGSTTNSDFAEIQLWESGKGKSKHTRFGKPQPAPAKVK